MATSIFLAKIIGAFYLVIGISMLANQDYYRRLYDHFLKSPVFMYIAGISCFMAGFLIITFHNVWEYSWVVLVTVFGWFELIKGILVLASPQAITRMARAKYKKKNAFQLLGVLALIAGIVFGYLGYIA